MPCACTSKTQYVAYRPDGSQSTYRTEPEAAADARRNGGTYTAIG